MSSKETKKRTPKGKALSEKLREKDERKAAESAELEADLAAARDSGGAESSEDESGEDRDARDADGPDSDDADALDDEVAGEEPADEEATDERDEDGGEESDDDEELVAAAIGYQRYVGLGFISLGLFAGYVASRLLRDIWQELASQPKFVQFAPQFASVPHEGEFVSRTTLSLLVGMVLGGLIVLRYYRSPDVRTWADEVADEISKVKWPTRKEVGNYTVIVIAGSALLTAFLALLDRFWAFVTNLIYSTGA